MNTRDKLNGRDEPPVTAGEDELAAFLAHALDQLKAGKAVDATLRFSDSKSLSREAERVLATSRLLLDCAAVAWESVMGPAPSQASEQRGGEVPVSESSPQSYPELVPGEFAALKLLGEGIWGRVWLARDLELERDVVLKSVRPAGDSKTRATRLEALRNEAILLAKFRHPNIVQVHAWRQSDSEHYIVMQYVSGGSLADRLERDGPFAWQDAARYVADVGEGLLQVHKLGIAHRDIKPANILWDSEHDEALLTDFGLSTLLDKHRNIAGSPVYMPPEAWEGDLSPLVDVYSLAASLFEFVTGVVPFAGPSAEQVRERSLRGLPNPDPRFRGVPKDLEHVIRSGLSPKPADRVPLQTFAKDLRSSLNCLLADSLLIPQDDDSAGQEVVVSLTVNRELPDGSLRRVSATGLTADNLTRDMRKVPPRPEQVVLTTGDRARIEVGSDCDGFIMVLNVGPTGNLHLLYPDREGRSLYGAPIRAHENLNILDVEMAPPAGSERLVAIWTRDRLPLKLEEISRIAAPAAEEISSPYVATRDMKRVRRSLLELPRRDWSVTILQFIHIS